jgi:single-strand DNA-binding protein
MSGLNRWVGIINLAADADLRFTQGGIAVLNFRGACNETFRKDNKDQEVVTWIQCVLWGKRGEALAKHLVKGQKLYVEGALRIGSYEDKEGVKKTKVEILVREVEFMGGKERGGGEQSRAPRAGSAPAPAQGGSSSAGGYDHHADQFAEDQDIPF